MIGAILDLRRGQRLVHLRADVLPAPVRVLIIDDDSAMVAVLRDYFQAKQGYVVATASTAEDGLMEAEHTRPDLILLDIRLPGMDGIEGLQKLRETVDRVPVIMVSGTADLMAPSAALALGALAYLAKPFNFESLDHVVALALEQNR